MRTLLMLYIVTICFFSCKKDEASDPVQQIFDSITPTNRLMEGVWKVVEVRDSNNVIVTDKVSPLLVSNLFQFNSSNGVMSTAGPLFMYMIYGDSCYTIIRNQLDQSFVYSDMNYGLTEGEWNIQKEIVTDRFTIELKLKYPTVQKIDELLNLMGIPPPAFIESIIYHKFLNVKIAIDDANKDQMIWDFDETIFYRSNIKDENLDFVLWLGVPEHYFSHCSIKLERQSSSIQQLVADAYAK
jgi:hypothetical protein